MTPRILDRLSFFTVCLCTATPLVVSGAIGLLPSQVAFALATWILVSVPLGIGIGHCVLNDE